MSDFCTSGNVPLTEAGATCDDGINEPSGIPANYTIGAIYNGDYASNWTCCSENVLPSSGLFPDTGDCPIGDSWRKAPELSDSFYISFSGSGRITSLFGICRNTNQPSIVANVAQTYSWGYGEQMPLNNVVYTSGLSVWETSVFTVDNSDWTSVSFDDGVNDRNLQYYSGNNGSDGFFSIDTFSDLYDGSFTDATLNTETNYFTGQPGNTILFKAGVGKYTAKWIWVFHAADNNVYKSTLILKQLSTEFPLGNSINTNHNLRTLCNATNFYNQCVSSGVANIYHLYRSIFNNCWTSPCDQSLRGGIYAIVGRN